MYMVRRRHGAARKVGAPSDWSRCGAGNAVFLSGRHAGGRGSASPRCCRARVTNSRQPGSDARTAAPRARERARAPPAARRPLSSERAARPAAARARARR